jgi:hypothetical protein
MKAKIPVLALSLALVAFASIGVYSHAATIQPNTPSSTASTSAVITPVWNSTLQLWVANVAGWARISVNVQNSGGFAGLVFSNYASGPYTGNVAGCLGAEFSGSFFVGGECQTGGSVINAVVITTIVQGAYVGVGTNNNQNAIVSIYATNEGSVVG